MSSQQPESDDPYRWCVYCKADCWPPAEDQEHADTCPTVTGLWPVRVEDIGPACAKCGYQSGTLCANCEAPLSVGDVYCLLDLDNDSRPSTRPGIGLVVCVGCAANREVQDA